jgi:hypothetical protein
VDFGRQEKHEKYPELNILRDKICRSAEHMCNLGDKARHLAPISSLKKLTIS